MTEKQFVKVRVFLAIILTLFLVFCGTVLGPELLRRIDAFSDDYSSTYSKLEDISSSDNNEAFCLNEVLVGGLLAFAKEWAEENDLTSTCGTIENAIRVQYRMLRGKTAEVGRETISFQTKLQQEPKNKTSKPNLSFIPSYVLERTRLLQHQAKNPTYTSIVEEIQSSHITKNHLRIHSISC